MKLKSLSISHHESWRDKPDGDKYNGKVEFFNAKGESLTIQLREDQLAGIVEVCSAGIVQAAQEAAQSIVASLNPVLQIEQEIQASDSNNNQITTKGE